MRRWWSAASPVPVAKNSARRETNYVSAVIVCMMDWIWYGHRQMFIDSEYPHLSPPTALRPLANKQTRIVPPPHPTPPYTHTHTHTHITHRRNVQTYSPKKKRSAQNPRTKAMVSATTGFVSLCVCVCVWHSMIMSVMSLSLLLRIHPRWSNPSTHMQNNKCVCAWDGGDCCGKVQSLP